MKSVSVRKKCDLAYCVFVGLAFITVIIWQIFHLPLPPWLLTDLPLTDSSFVILQIQVTIAVLPLAIIALITGMSKDTLYGVPVLKYVLRLRPVFLTYNSIAILQMFMIIIAFVSTSYHLRVTPHKQGLDRNPAGGDHENQGARKAVRQGYAHQEQDQQQDHTKRECGHDIHYAAPPSFLNTSFSATRFWMVRVRVNSAIRARPARMTHSPMGMGIFSTALILLTFKLY